MELNEVVSRFEGISGEQPCFTGICPVCGSASLLLMVYDDGHRAVMCGENDCDPGDILTAVDLTAMAMLEHTTLPSWMKPNPPEQEDKTEENAPKQTQAEILLQLVDATGASFFHNETKDAFASLQVNGHTEIVPIKSTDFSDWLQQLHYTEKGRPVGTEALNQTISILSAKARFGNSECIELHVRVANKDNAFWYDLTNPAWQAVRITAGDWIVCDNPPILFTRYRHQQAQCMPQHGGDVRKILQYVNIKGMDTLFLCWLVSCFVPDIPHVMPILFGEKGAAKSTASELLKKLIDPSVLGTLTLQNDLQSLVVSLQQHWFLPFDNVSRIGAETSDTLCRAITGNSIQQRRLHTNNEDVIYKFMVCLSINGINNVASRPDLLDRSILVELERIAEGDRKDLAEVWANFDADRPAILGGILDTLSTAIAIHPTVKLESRPRMSDFTRWGYAIGEALGGKGQEFLEQYAANRQEQNTEAIISDLVTLLVVKFMEGKDSWTGLMSDLLSALKSLAGQLDINVHSKSFPGQANSLARRLRLIKSNLEAVGIQYRCERTRAGSHVTLMSLDSSSQSSHRHQANEINASSGDGSVTISTAHVVSSPLSSQEIALQGNLCDDSDDSDDDFDVVEDLSPWD